MVLSEYEGGKVIIFASKHIENFPSAGVAKVKTEKSRLQKRKATLSLRNQCPILSWVSIEMFTVSQCFLYYYYDWIIIKSNSTFSTDNPPAKPAKRQKKDNTRNLGRRRSQNSWVRQATSEDILVFSKKFNMFGCESEHFPGFVRT